MLKYKIDDYTIEFKIPEWWNEIQLDSKEENFDSIPGNYLTNENLRKHCFKILMKTEQAKAEIPYKLFHLAIDIQDQKLISSIGIGILEYLDFANNEKPLHNLYIGISDSFIGQENLQLAKDYLKKAIMINDDKDTYQRHYSKIASQKLKELEKINDVNIFFTQRANFRNTLNKILNELNSTSEKIIIEKERLKGFLWAVDTKELSNLELAFLILLDSELNSINSKILTESILQQVQTVINEYHESVQTKFKIKLSGIVLYPTDLSDFWTISIDGAEYEVITIDFNRWEVIEINLSD